MKKFPTAFTILFGLIVVVAALILAGVQGALFYVAGLLVFSVNRFILSALSAGLPHVTDERSPPPRQVA